MSLVFNERTKLTAAWFNTLATALVAAGVFAPVVGLIYGLSPATVDTKLVMIVAALCLGIGLAIHAAGWLYLGRLRE